MKKIRRQHDVFGRFIFAIIVISMVLSFLAMMFLADPGEFIRLFGVVDVVLTAIMYISDRIMDVRLNMYRERIEISRACVRHAEERVQHQIELERLNDAYYFRI